MRILIDILHPAHVHFYRHFRREMLERGHDIKVVSRDKELTLELLRKFEINNEVLSRQGSGVAGLTAELIRRTLRLAAIARRWRPDVLTGIMGPSVALAGRALGIPSFVFYDTEHARMSNSWVYRLASNVITPDCYEGPTRDNFITYPGYQELAYLHPNRFQRDRDVVSEFGLDPNAPIILLRFVSSQASHDVGQHFLPDQQKREVAERMRPHGQVRISSETRLPSDLESLRLEGPTWKVHHLLSFASVLFAESATMCSEAAVLGTPAVYVAETSRGYLNDLHRRYGLVSIFKPPQVEESIRRAESLLEHSETVSQRHSELLQDKIDVTAWMVQLIEDLHSS